MRSIEAKMLRKNLLKEVYEDTPFGILSNGKLVGVVFSLAKLKERIAREEVIRGEQNCDHCGHCHNS